MPRPTPRAGKKTVAYTTRNLRVDLRDRLRVQAALRRTTMEDVLNVALEKGLPRLERT